MQSRLSDRQPDDGRSTRDRKYRFMRREGISSDRAWAAQSGYNYGGGGQVDVMEVPGGG